MMLSKLALKSSYVLLTALSIAHAGAIAILWWLPFAWWFVAVATMVCLVSFIYTLRLHALRNSNKAIVQVQTQADGKWLLQDKQGHTYTAELRGNSIRTTLLVLLNFVLPNSRTVLSVLILPDALDTTDFRRLRVHLLGQGE